MVSYDKELYLILGQKLRELRKEKGFSLDLVAEKVNMTKKTIQRYEKGEQRIKIEKLQELCNVYSYDVDVLNKEVRNEFDKKQKHSEFHSEFGTDKELQEYFANEPELLEMYRDIQNNDSLQLLFDSTKDLSPEDLKPVLDVIYLVRKSKGLD